MSRVTLDRDTLARLMAENGPVEVCDPSGRVVGQFAPHGGGQAKEPRVSEEELARREAAGGGRSLAEIMADLRKRAP
jgi:hypothetical protein